MKIFNTFDTKKIFLKNIPIWLDWVKVESGFYFDCQNE